MKDEISHLGNQRSFEVSLGVAEAGPATMSSVEIAELCEKRHHHVMRVLKTMLEALELSPPRFGGTYADAQGKVRPCFDLPRNLTVSLITGYSKALQMRPEDRFDWLRRNGWMKVTTFVRPDGSERINEQVRVTAKELTRFNEQARYRSPRRAGAPGL